MKYKIILSSLLATLVCCSLTAFDTQATNLLLDAIQKQSVDNMISAIYDNADIHAYHDQALLLALDKNFAEGIQILCDQSLSHHPYSMLLIMLIIYDLETNEQYNQRIVESIINILREYLSHLILNLKPVDRKMIHAAQVQDYNSVKLFLHAGADIHVGDGYLVALTTLSGNKLAERDNEDEIDYCTNPLLSLLFSWIKQNSSIDSFSNQTMKKISGIAQGLGYRSLFDIPEFPIIPVRTCSHEEPHYWSPTTNSDLNCSI